MKILKTINLLGLLLLSQSLWAHPHENIIDEFTHHFYSLSTVDSMIMVLSIIAVVLLLVSKPR